MKRFFCSVALLMLFFSLVSPAPVFAQRRRQVLKIASLVPESTPWGQALNQMANDWKTITNGEVELQIYHNGVQGNEADIIRKLRINEIQGAVVTSFGLNLITPEVLTLSAPFVIRNDRELDIVLANIRPDLEAKISDKGFFSLALTKVGWVRIFSRTPVLVPNDLKRIKIGSSPDEPELMQAFKTMGYQVVAVSGNDMLISLNGSLVDATYLSPLLAGATQIFGVAKNMASINLAPALGGIVLSRTAWQRVPEQYRNRLIENARRVEQGLNASIDRLDSDAVRTMTQYGLITNQLTPAQEQLWYDDMERAMPSLLGTTFDRNTYTKIDTLLRAYRSGR